jgi:hypothetical protein
MCVEAAASGSMVGRCFVRWSSCFHGLGDCLVSLCGEAVGSVDVVSEEAV